MSDHVLRCHWSVTLCSVQSSLDDCYWCLKLLSHFINTILYSADYCISCLCSMYPWCYERLLSARFMWVTTQCYSVQTRSVTFIIVGSWIVSVRLTVYTFYCNLCTVWLWDATELHIVEFWCDVTALVLCVSGVSCSWTCRVRTEGERVVGVKVGNWPL